VPSAQLDYLRAEIERMRYQANRQKNEIRQLEKARINTLPAEALLARMMVTIESLCAQRDRLRDEQGITYAKRGVG
jgi:predicted ribosome quality control (RQC) complex YloA/Tae2 family protein